MNEIPGVIRSPAVDVDGLTFEVEYTCHRCAMTTKISVPARDPAADVVSWLDVVMHYVGASHRRISPDCGGRHVDLKIPHANEGAPVGVPRAH